MMVYLGEDGSVVNAKNVGKNITTLAMNINVNSYMENIKVEQYKQYKHLTTFKKKIINITIRTKSYWQNIMRQKKNIS